MAITRRLAFYDLRDWWASDPRVRDILEIDEKGILPFFPAANQPESVPPYIRYDVDRRISVNKWWQHTEAVILDIFTEDIEDANELENIFIDYSSQGDESARDLEIWIAGQNRARSFEFHSIEYFGGGELNPPKEQGGVNYKTLAFLIHYSPMSGRLIKE
jgi:hypothetical protein